MGTANFTIGILGTYYVMHGAMPQKSRIILAILLLNIAIGCYVGIDAFIKTRHARKSM
jgi:hypothetical protein